MISILVAARNEEDNLLDCMRSLAALDYPKEKYKVIIGNDQSTDATRQIALDFCAMHNNFQLIDIEEDPRGLKAKARVMAQLDSHAEGEFYLITDADVQVKTTWAKYLVRSLEARTGVGSGTTMVQAGDTWGELQGIDWAYFMGLLNVISYSGVPATAVGNNMILRREAYWETGGYAAIKFSITEDYKLYSEVCARGWKWNNVMSPEVLAYSAPTKGFGPLLHQRKRWLSGGRELPFYWWILFGIFGLYYFVIPVCLFLAPIPAFVLLLAKFIFQTIQINKIFDLLGEPRPNIFKHFLYEIYLFIVSISTALFFLSPMRTQWKGRRY